MPVTRSGAVKVFAAILICRAVISSGQNFPGGFSFFLPPDDATSQKFMPDFPARPITGSDFVTTNADGHFSAAGRRLRFFGTSLTFDGAFPDRAKAAVIAGRLRKMGFNLVRFHHIDNSWSQGSLFVQGGTSRRLNPVTLDRLDRFIAELKKNGVYVDMNLHVSRSFLPADGVAGGDSIPNYGKGVTIFDPQLIDLQKEYATQLLTHVNPYTGLSLARDPVLAMVEITNENSLYRMWRDGVLIPIAQGGDLIERHSRMLDDLWNAFLLEKYSNAESLKTAWNAGTRPEGADDQIVDGGFEKDPVSKNWTLELHETAKAAMSIETAGASFGGVKCAKVAVTNSDGIGWHIQWKQVGLSVRRDSMVAVTFSGRADRTVSIAAAVMLDVSPWTVFSSPSFRMERQWKTFRFSFRASEDASKTVRLAFQIGGANAAFWFDDVRLASAGIQGLAGDESLSAGTVRRIAYSECVQYTDARVQDMSAFTIGLQNDYFDGMKSLLKTELGVKVPLAGTNWNVGPGDMVTQSRMDFIDNHSYWDHPQFPGVPWSSTDWLINNTPMVRETGGGTIPRLFGGTAFEGKPFTVSEYNHPFPNRYQSEGMLFLAAYGSFHDTDALMLFDYNGGTDWETDRIDGYFDVHRNTAMMALVPSCARAFREGMIANSKEPVLLNYSEANVLLLPKNDASGWAGPIFFPPMLTLRHAVRNASFDSQSPLNPASLPQPADNPYTTDTGEIIWNTDGILSAASDRFAGLTGFLSRFPDAAAGSMVLKKASDFAALTWVSLTSRPLSTASRSLFTLSSRVQNTGMTWDGTSTVHDQWGQATTLMQPVSVQLQLDVRADSIRIFPLDVTGAVAGSPVTVPPGQDGRFDVTLNQGRNKTVWFGLERFAANDTLPPETPEAGIPSSFRFYQNYPNPFKGLTTFRFDLPERGWLRVTVYDMKGRLVDTPADGQWEAGTHEIPWSGAAASGVYLCRHEYTMGTRRIVENRKIAVIK
jgi:hypothetical protein